jgi:hypothetical protein
MEGLGEELQAAKRTIDERRAEIARRSRNLRHLEAEIADTLGEVGASDAQANERAGLPLSWREMVALPDAPAIRRAAAVKHAEAYARNQRSLAERASLAASAFMRGQLQGRGRFHSGDSVGSRPSDAGSDAFSTYSAAQEVPDEDAAGNSGGGAGGGRGLRFGGIARGAGLAMSTLSLGGSPKPLLHIALPHDPAAGGGDSGSVRFGAADDGAAAAWGGEGGGQLQLADAATHADAAAALGSVARKRRAPPPVVPPAMELAAQKVERQMAAFVKAVALPGIASLAAVRAHRTKQVHLVEAALPAQEAADLLGPLRSGGPMDAALGLQPNIRIDMHRRVGERYVEQHKEELERRAAEESWRKGAEPPRLIAASAFAVPVQTQVRTEKSFSKLIRTATWAGVAPANVATMLVDGGARVADKDSESGSLRAQASESGLLASNRGAAGGGSDAGGSVDGEAEGARMAAMAPAAGDSIEPLGMLLPEAGAALSPEATRYSAVGDINVSALLQGFEPALAEQALKRRQRAAARIRAGLPPRSPPGSPGGTRATAGLPALADGSASQQPRLLLTGAGEPWGSDAAGAGAGAGGRGSPGGAAASAPLPGLALSLMTTGPAPGGGGGRRNTPFPAHGAALAAAAAAEVAGSCGDEDGDGSAVGHFGATAGAGTGAGAGSHDGRRPAFADSARSAGEGGGGAQALEAPLPLAARDDRGLVPQSLYAAFPGGMRPRPSGGQLAVLREVSDMEGGGWDAGAADAALTSAQLVTTQQPRQQQRGAGLGAAAAGSGKPAGGSAGASSSSGSPGKAGAPAFVRMMLKAMPAKGDIVNPMRSVARDFRTHFDSLLEQRLRKVLRKDEAILALIPQRTLDPPAEYVPPHVLERQAEAERLPFIGPGEAEKAIEDDAQRTADLHPFPPDVLRYSTDDVAWWVAKIGLAKYRVRFSEAGIDGETLMQMRAGDFVSALGIDDHSHVNALLAERELLLAGSASATLRKLADPADFASKTARLRDRIANQAPPLSVVFAAARAGRVREIEDAIRHGFDIEGEDAGGNTLFLVAAMHGHKRLLDLLLARGANMNHQNTDGNCALHFCMDPGTRRLADPDGSVAKYLVMHGAHCELRNRWGMDPYQGARPGTSVGKLRAGQAPVSVPPTASGGARARGGLAAAGSAVVAGGSAVDGAGASHAGSRPHSGAGGRALSAAGMGYTDDWSPAEPGL